MDIQLAAQYFYEHSQYIRGYSKDTIRRYRQAINYYCTFTGHTSLHQITPVTMRELFFNGRMERNWKPGTFISYQKSLNVFLEWCKGRTYIPENPIADLESPRLERRIPINLTKQDAYKLLEAVANYPHDNTFIRLRNHAIFATIIFAGLRKREILKLRYMDVDLENQTLFVNQGKGYKDRIIPIPHTLAQSLLRYLVERKKLKITCPAFFASSQGNRGISDTTIRRLVDLMRKASHIPFSLHKLRHTFATLMIEGGCDIYSLSKMMGHEDIRTTTWYLSATTNHLRSQMFKHPLNR